ncbi:chemosensory pili system protein ChpA (sensor histidine kinase/response regulator) [Thiogranum longum]|uniref:Chemotaxis protein CheA n=2 Tax=root TaxID=1 RepID=A0A4R1H5Y8_9GAMM|nr:Hpt domain-containing protein [Thiogranum longum]TCK17147.1 chemosensory pili system protein ChpA (sensor histidine kinase/response regulator) [Thiogranum longum]
MNQVIDFSTLTWVKNELDETLKEARQSLEAYVEDTSDVARLGFLSAHLHQVYGTLQMVELYGAALLAEEMEQVAVALADGKVAQQDDACNVLMRAILQLPDYLDRLISGSQDIPLVLLPILNDLRAVRGANLLSENVMFSPDLGAALPGDVASYTVEGDLVADAKQLRHRFQIGLLGWFRAGANEQKSLDSLSEVLDKLHGLGGDVSVTRLWWIAAGVIDAVQAGSLEGGVSVKRLMGQVDRQIKRLVDQGEAALAKEPATDLAKNLLFYVAQSSGAGERAEAIQATYQLQELLPGEEEMASARESLSGANTDLFETVAVAVKEELARLKDQLDVALRGGCEDSDALGEMVQTLGSLGDTLGMLSLGEARAAVVSKVDEIKSYQNAGEAPPDTVLMDAASTLLFVESSVESMGSGRAIDVSEETVDEHLAKSEFNQVMDVVLQEAIADLARAKEAIVGFTKGGEDAGDLGEVPQWFNQVKGGLLLLEETRAASIIDAAARYIEDKLIPGDAEVATQELDSLADAICGLEYYLESRRENRMYGHSAMNVAEKGVETLGYSIQGDEAGQPEDSPEGQAEFNDVLEPFDPDPGRESEAAGTDDTIEDAGQADIDVDVQASDKEAVAISDLPDLPDRDVVELPAAEQRENSAVAEEGPEVAEHVDESGLSADEEVSSIEEEDDGLAIIGDEVDEEILEIFIEEAEEEIESLGTRLPMWIQNNEDRDSLDTIRRSFHTLKGSGRLVGAMRIGEFAWAYENMLNRAIDGTIEVNAPMTDILERALDALVDLAGQVKNGSPVTRPVGWLMKAADAISKGEELPIAPEPLAQAAVPDVEVDTTPESITLQEPVLEDVAPELVETDYQDQADEPAELAAGDDDLIVDSVMDPMLYEIFNSESRGHLEVIRQFLSRVDNGDSCIDDTLIRALHTLHGSAHMAGSDPIADLSGELEQYTRRLFMAQEGMPEPGCAALQESVSQIQSMLDVLPGEHRAPEGFDEILSRITALRESAPSVQAVAEHPEDIHEAEAGIDSDAEPESVGESRLYVDIDPELLEIFLEESDENLETSDAALNRWRMDSNDREALAELQRALHTVKGGARMADLGPVGDLAHAVESLIITVNDCGSGENEQALHGVQSAQDALVGMLDEVRGNRPLSTQNELIEELQALRESVLSRSHDDGSPVEEPESPAEELPVANDPYAETDPELLEVFLEEAADILEHSEETLQNWKDDTENRELMAEFQRELHTLKGGSRMADITAIGDISHAVESLVEKVGAGEAEATPQVFGLLQEVHDVLAGMVADVAEHKPVADTPELVAELEALREGRKPAKRKKRKPAKVEPAVQPMVVEKDVETEERRVHSRSSQELVRVKASLLDNLVNYAGEVSIYRSRLEQQVGAYRFNLVELEQTVSRVREQLRKLEIETEAQVLFRYEREAEENDGEQEFDPLEMDRYSHMQQLSRSLVESCSDLGSLQGLLDNITRESETLLLQQSRVNTELQEGLMRTRMVPFLGLAPRMRRIVRQTCQELGKQAELELSGAEGEMDRAVVDRIIAPVEHMLRNAISHGIETPEQRLKAGKPEAGTIRITFERESSDVVLRMSDDGAGISLDAIRDKAIERGLMEKNAVLSDNEVLQFILETGFSTADKVTQVSGRGVGMDVVNSEVKQLGGSLHIDSRQGEGTTFTVRLPFTLALNQALLIEVGEDTYAVPLSSIEGIVRMRREDLKAYYDDPESRFEYGGYEYEVRHLGSVLGTGAPHLGSAQKRLPVLLARTGDHGVAFHVENLLGSREIVVKSVGPQISTVRGVSGATILGDGRVVMILDVVAMLRSVGSGSGMMEQVEELMQRPAERQGVTVMVVDDSITVRKVTTRLLERNDMNVISAKDGVDAVSKLQENIPDIMLLDIEMPRMDGFELATHIRNEARLRDIPIIMITSRTGDKHRQRAMQIGVNRYLGKPFQESDLMENITELLEE